MTVVVNPVRLDSGLVQRLIAAFRGGFVETLVEFGEMVCAIVGVFAFGVIVVNVKAESTAAASANILQHLKVSVRVAERGDRSTADMLMNADRLAHLVVDEIQLRQSHDDRLFVSQFEFRLDAAADHLFRRDAIGRFRPRAHELNAAT